MLATSFLHESFYIHAFQGLNRQFIVVSSFRLITVIIFRLVQTWYWLIMRLINRVMSHSGLQRDILAFYKQVLRKAQTQPPEIRKCIEDYAKREFRKNVVHVSCCSPF